MTHEQIAETLTRLRSYAIACYFTPDAHNRLKTTINTHAGRSFTLSIRDDGKIMLTIDDSITAVYDVLAVLDTPRPEIRLDHFGYRYTIINAVDLSEPDIAYAKEVGVFVLSYAQRNLAFQFFARLTERSIDQYAGALAAMVPIVSAEEGL